MIISVEFSFSNSSKQADICETIFINDKFQKLTSTAFLSFKATNSMGKKIVRKSKRKNINVFQQNIMNKMKKKVKTRQNMVLLCRFFHLLDYLTLINTLFKYLLHCLVSLTLEPFISRLEFFS